MKSDNDVPFAGETYVSLETFKRDGTGVKTPVWAAPHEGALVVMSAGDAFKVKRLRRDSRVRVAACDVRGNVRGEWRSGQGRIVEDPAEVAKAHGALRKKYGWLMAITDFFASLTGRRTKRAYLSLVIAAVASLLTACASAPPASVPPATAAPVSPAPEGPASPTAPAATDAPVAAASAPEAATPPAASIAVPDSIRAVVDAKDRLADDRALDQGRHPGELLAFLGAAPGQRIAEVGSYTGYMADLLGRAVAPSGKVYAQDPKKLNEATRPAWAKRKESPAMKTIVRVERPFDDPFPADLTGLDAVVVGLFYHDMVWLKIDRAKLNAAAFRALKPGGVYLVYDHSAKAGAGVGDAGKLHRIEEKTARAEIEAAGFKLAASGDFLRNAKDPRDWDASDDGPKDRRGTSDRFVLKFVKP